MQITLFVHDAVLEVGHTHAMIEILRRFPINRIEKLNIICLQHDTAEVLFPDFPEKIHFVKIPGQRIYPFIFKMLWFHFISILLYFKYAKTFRIGIGIASFSAQLINVQFIHQMWEKSYFSVQKLSPLSYCYKKVLFLYFNISEAIFYRNKKLLFVSLSSFISDYLKTKFNIDENRLITVYSSANIERFKTSKVSKQEIVNHLMIQYPQLQKLNLEKPIFLFVGAFERKGLYEVFKKLDHIEDYQLVVVGKPEKGSQLRIPQRDGIIRIEFTRNIESFYQLCDTFIFPTIYEPFGLVLTEAAMSGMIIYSNEKEVGAMEILKDLPEVYSLEKILPEAKKLTDQVREKLRNERIERLQEYSWEKAAKKWWCFVEENTND